MKTSCNLLLFSILPQLLKMNHLPKDLNRDTFDVNGGKLIVIFVIRSLDYLKSGQLAAPEREKE